MSESKYYAFVSYSHQDNRSQRDERPDADWIHWADWLHEAIEGYRVPADLVGKINSRGEAIPSRLAPIFLDEKELPTSNDLGAAIREALRESRYLIVVCSPRSASSRYVNEEVVEWLRMGRADHLLSIIVAGVHSTADGIVIPTDEYFPPALRWRVGGGDRVASGRVTTEPLYADVRTGDEKRELFAFERRSERELLEHNKLKVIAGLLGVSFDEIVRRDRERQARVIRRQRSMAAAFFVLAVTATVGGFVAVGQRREAVRQRLVAEDQRREAENRKLAAQRSAREARTAQAEAEELVHYMQDEVLEVVRPLGQIRVLSEVQAKIAAYQERHPAAAKDRDRQIREADLLYEKGKVASAEGKFGLSRDLYLAAFESLASQLGADRMDNYEETYRAVQYMQAIVDPMLKVSEGHSEGYAGALGMVDNAKALLASAKKKWPGDLLLAILEGGVQFNGGQVLLEQGKYAEALREFEASVELSRKLIAEGSNDWNILYIAYNAEMKMGDCQHALRDLEGARKSFDASHRLLQRLAREYPLEPLVARDLALSLERIGDLALDSGQFQKALASFRELVAVQEERSLQDPVNTLWKSDLASALVRFSDAALKVPSLDPAEARRSLEAAELELNQIRVRQNVWTNEQAALRRRIDDLRQKLK